MGISPVAAGTLDANQQVSQVSERPKLSYVNPDAKTMSLSEIKDAFKPKNLFGYTKINLEDLMILVLH